MDKCTDSGVMSPEVLEFADYIKAEENHKKVVAAIKKLAPKPKPKPRHWHRQKPGGRVQAQDGTIYGVAPDGSLRRTDKRRGKKRRGK